LHFAESQQTLTMNLLNPKRLWSVALLMGVSLLSAAPLEEQFRNLPPSAKRHTGPLFWLHGDESPERLNAILDKVAEGGNGSFTAESRPHRDWLGEDWYRDLGICLDASKRLDLQMWIFDEDWWPSQTVAGKVPEPYVAKRLIGEAQMVAPGGLYQANPAANPCFIALVAGRLVGDGAVDAASLVDLTPIARSGPVKWAPPAEGSQWQVMAFRWEPAPRLKQGKRFAIDGMSKDCVDWYLKTVYEPHHARFGADFGKTIPGFFYDEPETPGDWGTGLAETFKTMHIDWMPAMVAWKFKLAGEAQAAAFYQYAEARAETWGRVTYGGLSEWCRQRGVVSIGHFMEHGRLYLNPDYCAGDLTRLQKYSDMGGIDMVCHQMYPDQRPPAIYQTPKLGSSISHVYGKRDDLAMCEIFGGYNQKLTYPQMKWLCDQHQVRGINFMIPHSFNPRAPADKDYPPYFYNGGFEPRFALYRVWADYSSRLSVMLTGGRHVCPVAVLFSGNAGRVGAYTTPELLTSSLQDALYDCDWLPFERFDDALTRIDGRELRLHGERYRVLVVPPTEAMTYPTLAKAKAFYDAGGVVIGHGRLPTKSLTPGHTGAEITALCDELWGRGAVPGPAVCRTNANGGRSYYLSEMPQPAEVAACLVDAGVPPLVKVTGGETGDWLHALRRVDREGRDTLLIANQNTSGGARTFSLLIPGAKGAPEIWDAMRNEITTVPWRQESAGVAFELTLEPIESVLVRFGGAEPRPARLTSAAAAAATLAVTPDPTAVPVVYPVPEKGQKSPCPGAAFQGEVVLPADFVKPGRRVYLVCEMADSATEDAAALRVNGTFAGGFIGKPHRVDIARHLKAGRNEVRIEPFPVSKVWLECH
jgi:hypothetical protein